MIWYGIARALNSTKDKGVQVRRTRRRHLHAPRLLPASSLRVRALSIAIILLLAACVIVQLAQHHEHLFTLQTPNPTRCATERFLAGQPLWQPMEHNACDI
jgi:hypothetical protein